MKPPAWGQRPHSPFFQLIMSTYLQQNESFVGGAGVEPLPRSGVPQAPLLQNLVFATLDSEGG